MEEFTVGARIPCPAEAVTDGGRPQVIAQSSRR